MINQAASTAAPISSTTRASLDKLGFHDLFAITCCNNGRRWLQMGGSGTNKSTFEFASHPVAGLMIGLVATALIQSSSTVTSIIVGLVAGGLPIETAIPMVMGANIGTTVTNTIVSLGHIRNKEEFKRAFASATIHDFSTCSQFVSSFL